jgi:hypothetical protein
VILSEVQQPLVSKAKSVVRILNPEAEASSHTSMNRAKRFVKQGRAIWEADGIRFVRTVKQAIRNEMACRWRSVDESAVDRAVIRSRYSQVNWSASKNAFRDPWETPAIIIPGICRS